MSLKLIISLTFTIYLSFAQNQQWTVEKVKVKTTNGNITDLLFKKGKQRQIYHPEKRSLWVINISDQTLNKTKYFVTSWSFGGQSMLIRVFDPNIKNSPLCEVISFSEGSKLRVEKGNLQLLKYSDSVGTAKELSELEQWVTCRKL